MASEEGSSLAEIRRGRERETSPLASETRRATGADVRFWADPVEHNAAQPSNAKIDPRKPILIWVKTVVTGEFSCRELMKGVPLGVAPG